MRDRAPSRRESRRTAPARGRPTRSLVTPRIGAAEHAPQVLLALGLLRASAHDAPALDVLAKKLVGRRGHVMQRVTRMQIAGGTAMHAGDPRDPHAVLRMDRLFVPEVRPRPDRSRYAAGLLRDQVRAGRGADVLAGDSALAAEHLLLLEALRVFGTLELPERLRRDDHVSHGCCPAPGQRLACPSTHAAPHAPHTGVSLRRTQMGKVAIAFPSMVSSPSYSPASRAGISSTSRPMGASTLKGRMFLSANRTVIGASALTSGDKHPSRGGASSL